MCLILRTIHLLPKIWSFCAKSVCRPPFLCPASLFLPSCHPLVGREKGCLFYSNRFRKSDFFPRVSSFLKAGRGG